MDVITKTLSDRLDEAVKPYERCLFYVEQNDRVSIGQIDEIMDDGWSESLDNYISDVRREAAWRLADELVEREVITEDEVDDAIEWIEDHDTSTPDADLLGSTPEVLFRCPYLKSADESLVYLNNELSHADMARIALGLPEGFTDAVAEILPEIEGYQAEGGGWFCAQIVFSVNPEWVVDDGDTLTIHDPYVWITNPYQGNGMEARATGRSITIEVDKIGLDATTAGWSMNEVFGGVILESSVVERNSN